MRAVALASIVMLGACSKKNDDPTPTPAATTYATTWTADSKSYTATTSNGAVSNNTLIIGATQAVSSSESYSITLNVPAATGTYAIGSGTTATGTTSAGYSTTVAGANTGYVSASGIGTGTIVVTTLSSTEIIGTFTFTGLAANATGTSKTITNGKFAIKR